MGLSSEVRPERELRLAVVMYGGVSLAVYMNGVAQELLNLVRATAPDPKSSARNVPLYRDDQLRGRSAAVYREIARLSTRGAAPSSPLAAAAIRQRVVIDILTGTSAGGINAIFLAKALANGQGLDGLARMWETDADIDTLINDGRSRKGLPKLPPTLSPRSLLNSRRMYAKLREALDQMDAPDEKRSAIEPVGRPLVDELDLFVATTDLEGLRVQLQLGGGEVAEERRHRKAFRLRFGRSRNDFKSSDNLFLAFIARCTSSFPFAFEPMQFSQALEGWWGTAGGTDTSPWARHFGEYNGSPAPGGIAEHERSRPYGDGGYLDNKPFGYAIDTIAGRGGGDTARVERKLVFIDPDPERVLQRAPESGERPPVPNAVESTLAALRLPAYETIREDLLRLTERNRIVDKIQNVVRGVTGDFGRLDDNQRKRLAALLNARETFVNRDLDAIVALFGAPYGGYHRLKVSRLTDELAEFLANRLRIPLESDQYRLVRFVVRAWRDAVYAPNPEAQARGAGDAFCRKKTEFAFLVELDCSYRVRRLAFVIEQINRITSAEEGELKITLAESKPFGVDRSVLETPERLAELLAALHERRRLLSDALRTLRDHREALFGREGEQILPGFAAHAADIRSFIADLKGVGGDRERRKRAEELLRCNDAAGLEVLRKLHEEVAAAVRGFAQTASSASKKAVTDITRADATVTTTAVTGEIADHIVRHYYAWYELYDSMVFTIGHGSEVGEEIALVEPVRISPLSGPAAAGVGPGDARFLPAGVHQGHFGAFLDAGWRANDILLGRLNAAEKLIRMMLTGLPEQGEDKILGYIRQAQAAIVGEECGRVGSRTKQWMDAIPNANTPELVLDHVMANGMPRSDLARDRTLSWVSRGVRVAGRIFDQAADGTAAKGAANAFSRAGQVLAAVAEVAVPRRWWGLLLRRWVARLWLYAVILAALGIVFGKDEMRSLGLTVAGVVSGVALAAVVLRGWVLRTRWLRWVSLGMLAIAMGLAVVGATYLWSIRSLVVPILASMWGRVVGLFP